MSTEAGKSAKSDIPFFGVATYVVGMWVVFGFYFIGMIVKPFLHEQRVTPPAQNSRPTNPSSASPILSYDSRPAIDTDGTLQGLNARYAALAVKRGALRLGDTVAIEAFNVEAAEYRRAVESFRSLRAAQLQLLPFTPEAIQTIAISNSSPHSSATTNSYNLPATKEHHVPSYSRSNGTSVSGHYRTNRDSTLLNNYSTKGNINPHTGRPGTVQP
jgi:hypothetical protein